MSIIERLSGLWRKTFSVVVSEHVRYTSPTSPSTSYEALVRSGWRRNELIYACISKKAETASQVYLRVVDPDGRPLAGHRLQRLVERPNRDMSMSTFLKAIIIFQDLAGFAPFVKHRSQAGLTLALYPLRPDWLSIELDREGQIRGYKYSVRSGGEYVEMLYEPRDVIIFSHFDPLGSKFGYPPVAVLAHTGDMDNMITDYLRAIFAEGGVPPGILKTTKSITKAIAQQIREMYLEQYGGYKAWSAPLVLGDDTTYQKTGLGVNEMGLEILDERAEARICAVLKVPPAVVGVRIGLQRALEANIVGFHRNWWVNDLIPIYETIEDELNLAFADELGDNRFSFDYSDVYALSEDVNSRRKIAIEAFRYGAITRNEFNRLWGLPELGEAGEVYYLPGNVIETTIESSNGKGARLPERVKAGQPTYNPDEDENRAWAERKISAVAERHLEDEFKRLQESELIEALRQEKQTTPAGFWAQSEEQFYAMLLPVMIEIYKRLVKLAYDTLPAPPVAIDWDLYNSYAIDWAKQHTAQVVAQVSKTSMNGFLAEFERWVESGERLDALIKALEQYYSPVRAEMIAVTETTRAYANANLEYWSTLEYVKAFDWVTAVDELVCPICSAKSSANPHPLTAERPPAHVRCRCAVRPVL
jgi:HK97 family phage portal protein